MKKLLILLLVLSLLLSGCGSPGQRFKEPVTFYYIMDKHEYGYEFGADPVVFAPEEREAAGHLDDLDYLLALYMIGPAEEELRSPFPWGTRILSAEKIGTILKLKLTDTSATMSDVDFTRAAACLTLTCLNLTGAETVNIQSGSRSATMTRDNLILYDDSLEAASDEETK